MPPLETAATSSQTLAQRMAKGRIPVQEALHFAMILADSLRKIHESGQAHGAVSPECIALTRTGLDLLPCQANPGDITPYTPPEVIQGKPADSRSDVFAFGVVLYEMLTGRAPFQGDTPEDLTNAITNTAPSPSGSPAVDRLAASCMAKDPAARWSRMQKLLLELKLLSVAVRRSEASTTTRESDPVLRAEIAQSETRLTERLVLCENGILSCQQSIEEVTQRIVRIEQVLEGAGERFDRLEQGMEASNVRFEQSLQSSNERFDKVMLIAGERFDRLETGLTSTTERIDQALQKSDDRIDELQLLILNGEERVDGLEQLHQLAEERFDQGLKDCGMRVDGLEQVLHVTGERVNQLQQEQQTTMARFDEAMQLVTERFNQSMTSAGERFENIEQGLENVGTRFEQALLALSERLDGSMLSAGGRIENLEHAMEGYREQSAGLRDSVSEELALFERSLKSQTATIDSVRMAMAQTDDLVERVVEALESLQSVVLENSEERAMSLN